MNVLKGKLISTPAVRVSTGNGVKPIENWYNAKIYYWAKGMK
jgi:hypothetical protein